MRLPIPTCLACFGLFAGCFQLEPLPADTTSGSSGGSGTETSEGCAAVGERLCLEVVGPVAGPDSPNEIAVGVLDGDGTDVVVGAGPLTASGGEVAALFDVLSPESPSASFPVGPAIRRVITYPFFSNAAGPDVVALGVDGLFLIKLENWFNPTGMLDILESAECASPQDLVAFPPENIANAGLLISCFDGGRLARLAQGEGAFSFAGLSSIGDLVGPTLLEAADLSGDGSSELVVLDEVGDESWVRVYFVGGDQLESNARTALPVPGVVDMIAFKSESEQRGEIVLIRPVDESGGEVIIAGLDDQEQLAERQSIRIGTAPWRLTAADFDGVLGLDVAVSQGGSSAPDGVEGGVDFLLRTETGAMSYEGFLPLDGAIVDIVGAQFIGDLDDLAVARENGDQSEVLVLVSIP